MVSTNDKADPPADDFSAAASASSSKKTKRSYNYHSSSTLAQLAQDIEEAGGIEKCIGRDHHLFTNILSRPDRCSLYKPPSNPKYSEKLQKKVAEWQQLYKNGKYEKEVLSRYGVQAFKHQRQSTPQPQRPSSARPPSPRNLDDILAGFAKLNLGDNPQAGSSSPPPSPRQSSSNTKTYVRTRKMVPSNNNSSRLPPGTSKCHLFWPANF